MAMEVKLKPGWLSKDTQRAVQRVKEWSSTGKNQMTFGDSQSSENAAKKSKDLPKDASDD